MTRTEVGALLCWAVLAAGLFWRCLTLGREPDLIGLFIAWLGGVASLAIVFLIWRMHRRGVGRAEGGEVPPPPPELG